MVPTIKIENESGLLGMISKFSFEISADKFVPKIEVDVCSDLTEEAWKNLSESSKEVIFKTVGAFFNFTGVKILSPNYKEEIK